MCVILAAARIKRERRTALEEKKRRRFDAGRREEEEGEHRAMLFATLRASLRHHQIIRGHEDEMKEEGVKDCKASRATNQCVWDEFRLCLVYCVTFDLRVGCDEEQEEKECCATTQPLPLSNSHSHENSRMKDATYTLLACLLATEGKRRTVCDWKRV